MGPQFRSFYHVFSHKTPYMIEIVLLVKLITSLLCNLITRNLLNQEKKYLWLCECHGCVYWVWYLWFYYYHWVFTSVDGLLVPEGVICPVVSVSVLTLCIRYLWFYYWVFTSADGLLVPEGVICPVVSVRQWHGSLDIFIIEI